MNEQKVMIEWAVGELEALRSLVREEVAERIAEIREWFEQALVTEEFTAEERGKEFERRIFDLLESSLVAMYNRIRLAIPKPPEPPECGEGEEGG